MILEEFDLNDEAIINPSDLVEKVEGMPKVAVTCFWGDFEQEYMEFSWRKVWLRRYLLIFMERLYMKMEKLLKELAK